MKYLEFDVKNLLISRTAGDKTALISGAVGYFGLHFNFDEEFAALAGLKRVEFFKNRKTIVRDLVDEACAIPKEMLLDKAVFEIRAISGEMVATPWTSVAITESGAIQPEVPEEELPETMSYVKTPAGENTVAMLRNGDNGLEYSVNGEDFEPGINGIPDVPKTSDDKSYLRKNGDWVEYEVPETVEGLVGSTIEIAELATDADLAKVVAKVNELIGALSARGVIA